jgi:transcriptional regulator with XRE-family HTH domain
LMDTQDVSRSELANRLGKSKGHVTQLLGGNTNMTLRTLADVAYALDSSISVQARAHSTAASCVLLQKEWPHEQRPWRGLDQEGDAPCAARQASSTQTQGMAA